MINNPHKKTHSNAFLFSLALILIPSSPSNTSHSNLLPSFRSTKQHRLIDHPGVVVQPPGQAQIETDHLVFQRVNTESQCLRPPHCRCKVCSSWGGAAYPQGQPWQWETLPASRWATCPPTPRSLKVSMWKSKQMRAQTFQRSIILSFSWQKSNRGKRTNIHPCYQK